MVSLVEAARARMTLKSAPAQYKAGRVRGVLLSGLAVVLSDLSERLCCRLLKQYSLDGSATVDYNTFLKNLSVSNDTNFRYLLSNPGKDLPERVAKGCNVSFLPYGNASRYEKRYPPQRYP